MKGLKQKLKKDWGVKCKEFSPLCATCLIWRAFETIDELYRTKYHLADWKKINGKNY